MKRLLQLKRALILVWRIARGWTAVLLVVTTLVPKMASLFLSVTTRSLFCAWFWRSGYARPVTANANA